jgi:hypothetical protein
VWQDRRVAVSPQAAQRLHLRAALLKDQVMDGV